MKCLRIINNLLQPISMVSCGTSPIPQPLNKFRALRCDLSAKNPNKKEEVTLRQPQAILEEIKALDEEINQILLNIKGLL
jgi:hypothetical protein